MNNTELLICDCCSVEHQIIFRHDKEDNWVYAEIHLAKTTFWRRLKYGIKYIFGYKCKYGAFEEFILNKNHIVSLNNIIFNLENNGTERNKESSL